MNSRTDEFFDTLLHEFRDQFNGTRLKPPTTLHQLDELQHPGGSVRFENGEEIGEERAVGLPG